MIEGFAGADDLYGVLAGAAVVLAGVLVLVIAGRRRRARGKQLMTVMREDDFTAAADGGAFMEDVADVREAPLHEVESALQTAVARGQDEKTAGLCLDLARRKLAGGDRKGARDLLLQCLRTATATGQRETHARARVTLGEIAHAGGDLTTACEHWQIARQIFHETGLTREHDVVEAKMLANGCPTDWVLTDF